MEKLCIFKKRSIYLVSAKLYSVRKKDNLIISTLNPIKPTLLSADKLAITAAICSMILVIVLITSILGAGGSNNRVIIEMKKILTFIM